MFQLVHAFLFCYAVIMFAFGLIGTITPRVSSGNGESLHLRETKLSQGMCKIHVVKMTFFRASFVAPFLLSNELSTPLPPTNIQLFVFLLNAYSHLETGHTFFYKR